MDAELQGFLDRRRERPGDCSICGRPFKDHRAKITEPAQGCALAELLDGIADVMKEKVSGGN